MATSSEKRPLSPTTSTDKVSQPDTKRTCLQKRGLVLKKTNPVVGGLPEDLWTIVLENSAPDFLLRARLVSTQFRDLLKRENAWRNARICHFGAVDGMPDPPPGLTEMQYAILLTSTKCQVRSCQHKAHKPFWGFQRRWCHDHLQHFTMTTNQPLPPHITAFGLTWNDLTTRLHLPDEWIDVRYHHNRPGPMSKDSPIYGTNQTGWMEFYDRRDLDTIAAHVKSCPPKTFGSAIYLIDLDNPAIKRLCDRNAARRAHMRSMRDWERELKTAKAAQAANHRSQRHEAFEALALQHDPSLQSFDLVKLSEAFDRASRVGKPPTQQAWAHLKKRLDKEKAVRAETLLHVKSLMDSFSPAVIKAIIVVFQRKITEHRKRLRRLQTGA